MLEYPLIFQGIFFYGYGWCFCRRGEGVMKYGAIRCKSSAKMYHGTIIDIKFLVINCLTCKKENYGNQTRTEKNC